MKAWAALMRKTRPAGANGVPPTTPVRMGLRDARAAIDFPVDSPIHMHALPESRALTALRRATADHHRAVEAVTRLDGDWGLDHYTRVLWGFEAFLKHWEPAMQAALPHRLRPWFASRSRMPFLQADLDLLGRPAPPPEGQDAALRPWPRLSSPAAAMGSLYVLEGSALGGQLIARRLRERHGRGAGEGGAYFTGWAARTGEMWRQFRAELAAELGDDEAAIAQACEGAVDTFRALIGHFEALVDEHIAA